jgi:hypothetical protein
MTALVASSIALVVPLLCGAVFASADDKLADVDPRVVVESYLFNRESFDRFACVFEIRKGIARDQEAALRGEFPVEISASGHWYVDREKSKFSTIADPVKLRILMKLPGTTDRSAGRTSIPLPFHNLVQLDDGKHLLYYAPFHRHAEIQDPALRRSRIVYSPLDMGTMGEGEANSPAVHIRRYLDQKKHVAAERRGERLVVELGDSPKNLHVRYFFDPAKGCSLVRCESAFEGGMPQAVTVVTDLRNCDNMSWFPFRVVNTIQDPEKKLRVREIAVRELSLARPPDEVFAITLEKGTAVYDGFSHNVFPLQLKQEERIDLGGLAPLFGRLRADAQKQRERENNRPSQESGGTTRSVGAQAQASSVDWLSSWTLGIAGLVVGASLLGLRRLCGRWPASKRDGGAEDAASLVE